MKRWGIALVALVVAAALGAIAATGLAGGDERVPLVIEADRELGVLAVERAPRPARVGLRAKRKGKQKLEFFQTPDPLEVAPQTEEGATLSCPRGYRAIGAYFFTGRTGTFLDLSAPEIAAPSPGGSEPAKPSKRNWVIGVYNSTAEADQVIFGVSCLNKLK